jgi:hypothetical protein
VNVDVDDTSSGHDLQLRNEVMQEAGERFLRHLEGTAMPHFGKRRAEDAVERQSNMGLISGGVLMEGVQDISSESEAYDNVASQSSSSLPANQVETPNTSDPPESTHDQLKERFEDEAESEETIRFPEDMSDPSVMHGTSDETIALCLSDIEAEPLGPGGWESWLDEAFQESEFPILDLGAGDDHAILLST